MPCPLKAWMHICHSLTSDRPLRWGHWGSLWPSLLNGLQFGHATVQKGEIFMNTELNCKLRGCIGKESLPVAASASNQMKGPSADWQKQVLRLGGRIRNRMWSWPNLAHHFASLIPTKDVRGGRRDTRGPIPIGGNSEAMRRKDGKKEHGKFPPATQTRVQQSRLFCYLTESECSANKNTECHLSPIGIQMWQPWD